MSSSTEPRPGGNRATLVALVALALFCGALVAVQTRINGQLGADVGDGFIAAVISFGSGLVVVTIVLAVSRRGRAGIGVVTRAVRAGELPWWHTAGGLGGALFVLSQGLYAGALGVALFTVAVVAGQTISGLVIDSRGIGAIPARAITVTRVVGAIVSLVAVVLAILPQLSGHFQVLVTILPFIVGLLLGVQQALNGQVKTLAGSAITATFFNFAYGTALLLVFAIINLIVAGVPHGFPTNPIYYAGGLIGVIFIAGNARVVPIIGVLLQSLAAVSGQLVMAVVLDLVAPSDDGGVTIATVGGAVLTLIAVAITVIPSRVIAGKATAR